MRRVVITGVGIETPMGRTLSEVRERFERAESAVRLAPTSSESRRRAAAFLDGDPADGIPGNLVKLVDRTGLIGLHASDAVMADAGLAPGSFDATRIGTMIGVGVGSSVTNHEAHQEFFRKDHVGPLTLLRQLHNSAASHISMRHGLLGECSTYAIACSSSAAALGTALRMIRHGYLDMALAGGTEAPLGESTFRAWEAMRVMGRVDPADPGGTCRPFSKSRTGIVLGEGAVLYMLEAEEHAKARGARIHATLAGYGVSADAGHITLPNQRGQVAAMQAALADAGLSPGDIGYVNAHGTATGPGDIIETRSMREAFGARADATPVSSTKSFHGHLLGASAAIELLAALIAVKDGVLAPTINLDTPDPECDLDYVANAARTGVDVQAAMSNNFAFGGSNVSLILTR